MIIKLLLLVRKSFLSPRAKIVLFHYATLSSSGWVKETVGFLSSSHLRVRQAVQSVVSPSVRQPVIDQLPGTCRVTYVRT